MTNAPVAVRGLGRVLTGWWSDRIGSKHLVTAGMLVQRRYG